MSVPDGVSLCLTWPFPFIPLKTRCGGLEMPLDTASLEDAGLAAAPNPGATPSRGHPIAGLEHPPSFCLPASLSLGCQGHGSTHVLKVPQMVIPSDRSPRTAVGSSEGCYRGSEGAAPRWGWHSCIGLPTSTGKFGGGCNKRCQKLLDLRSRGFVTTGTSYSS